MRNFIKTWILIIVVAASNSLLAQDGAQLFKSRCNTCHMIDKNSTGPKLKGVMQKWKDAGEGELIYQWVTNSTTLIASGKSEMAKAISSFSATAMPAQTSTKEEVDAILNYVDTYVEPAQGGTTAVADSTGVLSAVPMIDYKYNLSVFNWLLFLTVVLIVIIIVLAGSIIVFVKSDFFKKKVSEKANTVTILTIILTLGTLFTSSNASALTFIHAGEGAKDGPWLLVENMDLYGLLAINVVLMFVVLYLRHLFNQMVSMTKKPEELAVEVPVIQLKKINAILTDVVPIEEEHKILMDHEYDGIQELDNNLPPWWVWMFVGCIIFAFVYLINYHVLGTSDLQIKAYEKEMVQAQKDIDKYLTESAMNVDETNATLMTSPSDLSAGKGIFANNCTTCHKAKGEGDVGPNLTDKNWIYGYDIKEVFLSVKKGRPAGMPEHASKLNPIQIQQVASYVLSLPATKGKEPQGDILEK